MADSFDTGWLTLKTYYSQVRFSGQVLERSGSSVRIRVSCQSRGIDGAWWQDTYHVYFTVTTSYGSDVTIDMGPQTSSGSTYTQTRDFTYSVGYGAGSCTCRFTAKQSWGGTSTRSGSGTLTWDDTYTRPAAPEITGYTSTNGYQERLTFSTHSSAQAAITATNVERATLTDSNSASWSASSASSPYTNAGKKNGAAISTRVATNARNGGWQRSGTALILQAPTDPTGFSVAANGVFGASFSWRNTHGKTDYYTYLYEGDVSVGSDGKPSAGSATLIAKLSPGVSSYSAKSLWQSGGGQSTKTFSLVQVSSYDAWKRSGKSSLKTSGFMLDGFASKVLKATLTNGALPPLPATDVVAQNVMSGGKVSDTQAVVSWNASASTGDRPRTGWRILCNGVQVDTFQDASGGAKTRTVSVNLLGVAASFTVVAYGIVGETPAQAARTIYGTLPGVSSIQFSRAGESISASAVLAAEEGYPNRVEFGYRVGSSGDWSTVYGRSIVIDGDEYSYDAFQLRARVVPDNGIDVESHASAYTQAQVSAGCPAAPSVDVSQNNGYPDGSHCVVAWEPSELSGVEAADSYRVVYVQGGVEHLVVQVQADGSETYSCDFLWMASQAITVRVYAVRNGWLSSPTDAPYRYNPQFLEPPTLVSIERESGMDGYYFRLSFEHATGGITYGSGTAGAGYRYTLYIDGEKADYQDPPATEVVPLSDQSPTVLMRIVSPRAVYVRMTATDEQRESGLSNSLSAQYQAGGVGIFAYQCGSLVIEDCEVENVSGCIRAVNGSSVSMINCTLRIKEGSSDYYDIDGTSSIFESNGYFE